jgi:hypothetical protein
LPVLLDRAEDADIGRIKAKVLHSFGSFAECDHKSGHRVQGSVSCSIKSILVL